MAEELIPHKFFHKTFGPKKVGIVGPVASFLSPLKMEFVANFVTMAMLTEFSILDDTHCCFFFPETVENHSGIPSESSSGSIFAQTQVLCKFPPSKATASTLPALSSSSISMHSDETVTLFYTWKVFCRVVEDVSDCFD